MIISSTFSCLEKRSFISALDKELLARNKWAVFRSSITVHFFSFYTDDVKIEISHHKMYFPLLDLCTVTVVIRVCTCNQSSFKKVSTYPNKEHVFHVVYLDLNCQW
ncbi:hypothetical protein CHS0354_014398 [Potamilus streckersoni]|uniref:Uncharacterized protein n=1 Tax=Potamilus streckersoni TaxID=2493646 RepID=A0AAE0SAB5_9BIVA|nr:hypothetical protein CHS0354_014398 [Potamilus streckersoni]